ALVPWGKSIDLWDVSTGKPHRAFAGHASLIPHLTFLPDGKSVATATNDGNVWIWDAATGKPLRHFRHADPHLSAANRCFTRDGATLVTREPGNLLGFWDLATGKAKTFPVPAAAPWELRDVADSGNTVALRTPDDVLLWEVGAARFRHRLGPLKCPNQVAFSPGDRLLFAEGEQTSRVWDVRTGKERWQLPRAPGGFPR